MGRCYVCGMSDTYPKITLSGGKCNWCHVSELEQCMQIIRPIILCRGNKVYTGEKFSPNTPVGSLVDVLFKLKEDGVSDAILFSLNSLIPIDIAVIACSFGINLTIGGGVNDMDDVGQLFRAGADRVAINYGLTGHNLLEDANAKYGKISAVVDVNRGIVVQQKQSLELLSTTPSVWSHRLQSRGASEIILQCVDREGTREGYDHNLIYQVATAVRVPVVASGGLRDAADACMAYFDSGADYIGFSEMGLDGMLLPSDLAREIRDRSFTCES